VLRGPTLTFTASQATSIVAVIAAPIPMMADFISDEVYLCCYRAGSYSVAHH
jgi:hypothetical protein